MLQDELFIAPRVGKAVQEQFDQMLERYDGRNGNFIRRKLNEIIRQEPYCFDAYFLRYQILLDEDNRVAAGKELKRAYEVAVELITRDTGKWPRNIPWELEVNRPLLRALYGGAICQWWKDDPAQEILRKLLVVCPIDNLGARFALLGLKMGLSYLSWQELEANEMEMLRWFAEHAGKFPEEFGEYLEVME